MLSEYLSMSHASIAISSFHQVVGFAFSSVVITATHRACSVQCRENTGQVLYPADVVLLEGILVFYFPELRNMFHMKLFVDTDPDTRLSRRGRGGSC